MRRALECHLSSSGSMVTIGFAAGSPVCVLKGLCSLVLEKENSLLLSCQEAFLTDQTNIEIASTTTAKRETTQNRIDRCTYEKIKTTQAGNVRPVAKRGKMRLFLILSRSAVLAFFSFSVIITCAHLLSLSFSLT